MSRGSGEVARAGEECWVYKLVFVLVESGRTFAQWTGGRVIQLVLDIQMAWVMGGHRLEGSIWIRLIRMLM